MKAIINGKIILSDTVVKNKVLIFDEDIKNIAEEIPEDDITIIDAKGKYVSPGFIDIHVHGAGGYDTMDGSIKSLNKISSTIAKKGVTAYLPTTMTMSEDKIINALSAIKKYVTMKNNDGAKILGAHLEGPFINPQKKGAQNEKYIKRPSKKFISDYLEIIKVITYAPEMDVDNSFIKQMKIHDIILSLGHSNGTFEQAMEAINLGAKSFTHLFNAMSGLHHREPGLVGAALSSDAYVELIADNIHVRSELYNMLLKVKKERLILVTDGMKAKCLKNGTYDLGGQKVIVDDTSARLEDGTLAGSILTMNSAVKNVYHSTSSSIIDIIKLASLYPAKLLKVDDEIGSITIGKKADLVIFDELFNVDKVFIEGKCQEI